MKFANWKDSLELVGIAAIVVSLVFVGYELRQNTAIARSDAYSSFSSRFFELASNAALDKRMSGLISQVNQGALPGDFKPDLIEHRLLDQVWATTPDATPEYSESLNLMGFVQLDQKSCPNGYRRRQSIVHNNNFS